MERIWLAKDYVELNLYTSPGMGLDSIPLGSTRVFALIDRQSFNIYFLFLRRTAIPRTYRLLKCCPCYRLVTLQQRYLSYDIPEKLDWVNTFYESLYYVLTNVIQELGDLDQVEKEFILPWGKGTRREVLPLFKGHFNDTEGRSPGFLECYLALMKRRCPEYHPTVKGDCIVLTVPRRDRGMVQRYAHQFTKHKLWFERTGTLDDRLRIPKAYLGFETGKIWKLLRQLTPASRVTGEQELAMVLRGPRDEDLMVGCYNWPFGNADGTWVQPRGTLMHEVTIV